MKPDLDERLDRLFAAYRESLPEIEPTPQFLPGIWQKIDSAKPMGWLFPLQRFAVRVVAGAALAAAVLTGSAIYTSRSSPVDADELGANYIDVLTLASIDEDEGVLWMQAGDVR
jgi:hypothetical protein